MCPVRVAVAPPDVPGLVVLDLSGNKLTALPPRVFHRLKNLKTLDLSGNALAELPDDMYGTLGCRFCVCCAVDALRCMVLTFLF